MNKKQLLANLIASNHPHWQVTLPMPPSVNQAYVNATKGRRSSVCLKRWRSVAQTFILPAVARCGVPEDMLPPPYLVVYEMQKPNDIRRDCANFEKAISDLLVGCGVLDDDSKIEANLQFWSDVKGKEVVVSIWSLRDFL